MNDMAPRPANSDSARSSALTPEALRGMAFDRVSFARRGYSEQQVDRAIESAADSLSDMVAENARLRADVQRHKDWLRANNVAATDVGTVTTGVPNVDAILEYSRAQQLADRTIVTAKAEARRLLESARFQADATLSEGQEEAARAAEEAARAYRARVLAYNPHQEQYERLTAYLRSTAEALNAAADTFSQSAPVSIQARLRAADAATEHQ